MEPFDSSARVAFENILLATDFGPSSQAALLYSLALARRTRTRLFLAHVVNPLKLLGHDAVQRAVNDAWRNAHTEMTNQLIEGRLEGVENHVVVAQGDIWEELSKMIQKFKVDLLVVGTHGRTGVLKMLLGSTAEKIFRQCPVPVLTVGAKLEGRVPKLPGPERVLYSTGFAPQSLYAGHYALAIAQQQQSRLAMLHVIREVENDSPVKRNELEAEAKDRLRSLIPPDATLPSAPEVFVAFGAPGDAILKLAAEWKPDLIVLGVRRPEADARRITRATAYNVVSQAPCPVLTVKTPDGG
ncbi:MAG TPA: universal stress protein [Terriglobales bacterium]|nr:universal stress protein [Terriglobales bacterium]